jgi:hypothetical protein
MITAHSPEALYQGIKYHLFFDVGYEHSSLARGPFLGVRAVVYRSVLRDRRQLRLAETSKIAFGIKGSVGCTG